MPPSVKEQTYLTRLFGILDALRDNIIRPIDANSLIKTRYITSEGVDTEQWIGMLRDELRTSAIYPSGVVDIWLMTFSGLRGLPQAQKGAIGVFDKPVQIYIDYFADYRQGLDYDATDPDDIKTNSEREFLTKCFLFDYKLENATTCLTSGVEVQSFDIRFSLKQFNTDTCHRAACVLNLLVSENIL